jgi:hypothetical protein
MTTFGVSPTPSQRIMRGRSAIFGIGYVAAMMGSPIAQRRATSRARARALSPRARARRRCAARARRSAPSARLGEDGCRRREKEGGYPSEPRDRLPDEAEQEEGGAAEEPGQALGRGQAPDLEAERDVLANRPPREERVLLEHDGGERLARPHPVEGHASLGRRLEPRDDLEQGRLAAPRGTEDRDELAVPRCPGRRCRGPRADPRPARGRPSRSSRPARAWMRAGIAVSGRGGPRPPAATPRRSRGGRPRTRPGRLPSSAPCSPRG